MNPALALAALALGLGFTSTARPEVDRDELRTSLIPAGASYVVHIDLDAVKRTTLWKMAMQEGGPFEDALEELDEVERELGLDPLTDLHSITVYGSQLGGDPDAALIVTSERIDQAIGRIAEQDEYRFMEVDGIELHQMDDGGETIVGHVHELRDGKRLVVVSSSVEGAVRAARVTHGDAESLADDAGAALRARPGQGSFLYVEAAGGLPGVDYKPASQVFGLAQGIQFDFGEAGGSLFVHAAVATETEDDALDLADTVEGLLALARLALREENGVPPEVRGLLRALRVNTRGSAITLDFEYDVAGLFSMIQALEDMDYR